MKRIEVAIIGSGAVTQKGYLPASKSLSQLQVTWIVDPNIDRARETARRFGVANWAGDYHEVLDKVQAVVVATPPALHASITKDCLMHRLHVLCEKPLTRTVEEARELVEIAHNYQVHFAVSSNRRFCASSQLLKYIIGAGFLGRLSGFEVEEGHQLRWEAQSGYRFKKDLTGGGVLAEFGPHVLDPLLWWLGNDVKVKKYRDDNLGGVEANAWIELTMKENANEIQGLVELSNTRDLRNTIRIYGERGLIEAPLLGGESVVFYPNSDQKSGLEIRPTNLSDYPKTWTDQIRAQLSAFVESIADNDVRYVRASEAVRVTEIVEQCYSIREVILQPWEAKWLKLEGKNGWVVHETETRPQK